MTFKPTSRKKAGELFDVISSKDSDAAKIANLTLPNDSQKYDGGRLYKRYERLAAMHVEDTALAKEQFGQDQKKIKS